MDKYEKTIYDHLAELQHKNYNLMLDSKYDFWTYNEITNKIFNIIDSLHEIEEKLKE